MIQPARQSLEVLEWLPTKLHSGVSTLHYQELLAKEDNSPARNAEFPLCSLRSDNSSASTLVKVATFGGEIPKRQNFWTASNLELAFYRQLITTCTSGTIQKSRYLDISWQMAPTLQPYLHSNHRHRGSRIQSPSSTKHLRALFQETSKDTQRLDEIRLIHPGWLKYVGMIWKNVTPQSRMAWMEDHDGRRIV